MKHIMNDEEMVHYQETYDAAEKWKELYLNKQQMMLDEDQATIISKLVADNCPDESLFIDAWLHFCIKGQENGM